MNSCKGKERREKGHGIEDKCAGLGVFRMVGYELCEMDLG